MASKSTQIDRTDMAILHLLQQNARRHTTESIAERVDVSSSTVGNRIRKMEEDGVIRGYNPNIDYAKVGFDHHCIVICTTPFEDPEKYADRIIESVNGVINVRRFLTTTCNLSVEIVAFTRSEFEASLQELNETEAKIERYELVGSEETCPFDHFGKEYTDEGGRTNG